MDEPVNYALVENGVVTNIIWLCPSNAGDFPGAVCVSDRPVTIGDLYVEGAFTRGGEPVLAFAKTEAAAVEAQTYCDEQILNDEMIAPAVTITE